MDLLNVLSCGAGLMAGVDVSLRVVQHRQPRPFPHQLAGLLDHPLRLQYRDPMALLGAFGVTPGITVLDLGCGSGLFTVDLARMVGSEGKVYAVDLQSQMVEKARSRVMAAELAGRVQFYHNGVYHLPLAENSVDLAVLIATLAEIPDRLLAFRELHRVLKPGARLAISEEILHPGYLPAILVRRWLRASGFRYGGQRGTPFCYSLLYFKEWQV